VTHRRHLANMVMPVLIVLIVYVAAALVFGLVFGWGRLHDDFWPPDRSFIGPNLCASFVLVLALIAHNEYVVAEHARSLHEDHKKMFSDLRDSILHPTEEAEASIAAEVEARFKADVLDRLDCETPGGVGTIAAALKVLPDKATPKA
jgi:hypothetical protein